MRPVIAFSYALSLTLAQSLLTPVHYSGSLESYYYFRTGNTNAGIEVSDAGITITGDFADTEVLCDTLDGAQLIYYTDGSAGTLVTSNCYNVYYMVNQEQQSLSWGSCEEFPFFETICGSQSQSSDAGSSTPTSSTSPGTVTSPSISSATSGTVTPNSVTPDPQRTTTFASGIAVVNAPKSTLVEGFGTTVVTTMIDGLVSIYTTFCPLTVEAADKTTVITVTSCHDNACSETPVTTGVTVITTTQQGVETVFTTYCPLLTTVPVVAAATSTGTATATGKTVATGKNTVASEITIAGQATVAVQTTVAGQTTVSGGAVVSPAVAAQSSASATQTSHTVSEFQGAASKLTTISAGLVVIAAALFL